METEKTITKFFLDQGILGAFLLLMVYFAWFQYQREILDVDECKRELKYQNQKFIELQERQISILENQTLLYQQLKNEKQ